jgi:ferric-dicitrate binding protein FerR (iron transport regulator)
VAGDVTLPSFRADYMPRGRLSVVQGSVDGRKAVGLRTDTGLYKGTVYVRSAARPLPFAVTSVQYQGASAKTQFSLGPWNQHPRVRAPSHAVPVAKVLHS